VPHEAFLAGYGAFGTFNGAYVLFVTADQRVGFSQWGGAILGPALTPGLWYHVAVSSTGTAASLYVNGELADAANLLSDTPSGTTFYMGQLGVDDGRRLQGSLDEVTIYDRALCAGEIREIYRAGSAGKDGVAPANDCDANLVSDSCAPDCNGNKIADACDISSGRSRDCDANGIPDDCEDDCNANGTADACDIFSGGSEDSDADGIPDECQPQAPVPGGLVSWWTGEGDASDVVGPNSGLLQWGATIDAGMVGDAFRFQEFNDYVEAPAMDLPIGNADRTLELWMEVDAFVAGEAFVAGYGQFGFLNEAYVLFAAGNQIGFSQWGASVIGPALETGAWYHVAVTNAGNWVTLYVNGAVANAGELTIDTPDGTMFYMGGLPGDGGRRLRGSVDDVSIYDRALCAGEIEAIYMAKARGKSFDVEMSDCNRNSVPDSCDILSGTSADAEGNGIPDECEAGHEARFRRGDADGSGKIDITDAVATLMFLFMGGTAPECKDAADSDDSGKLDITDAVSSLMFQFMGGTPPAPPGPTSCGVDPTPGDEYAECTYTRC
jgi:hypothetical protein